VGWINAGRGHCWRPIWLLALVACLCGVWVVHQTPGTYISPSPGQPEAPAQWHMAATSMPSEAALLLTSTCMPAPSQERGHYRMGTLSPVTLTVVYDNNPFDSRLKTAWGFACLVETDSTTVLFDTGGDGATLMGNLAALAIDPHCIDRVVLSHYHGDHTGGSDSLLGVEGRRTVYVPRSFPSDFKARVAQRAQVVEVSEPMVIADQIRTTGEIGAAIVEQSLIVETDQGLVLVTGCAHPGIVEIVRQAKRYGDVYLVVGGLHLKDKSADEIKMVIEMLRDLGVRKVAPCHCTGEEAFRLFKAAFGAGFVPTGVGTVIRSSDASYPE